MDHESFSIATSSITKVAYLEDIPTSLLDFSLVNSPIIFASDRPFNRFLDPRRVSQVNHRRDNDVTVFPGHLGDQAEVQQASLTAHGEVLGIQKKALYLN